MIHALLHNKLKYSFSDSFKPSEDSLTSSVIGLLQYLPDAVFWQLLRASCGEQSILPKDIGEILSVNFWEKMKPDGIHNLRYVEPDVWIECEKHDIIIEAKKSDSSKQHENQWEKEIMSYNKTFVDCEKEKELIFIALGGNELLKDPSLEVDGKPYTVYTSKWYNLLREIDKYRQTKVKNKEIRLLNDLVEILAKHGHFKIEWLENMKPVNIDQNSAKTITLWKFDNKAILQDFYKYRKPITINNIFKIWKIN